MLFRMLYAVNMFILAHRIEKFNVLPCVRKEDEHYSLIIIWDDHGHSDKQMIANQCQKIAPTLIRGHVPII